MWGGTTTPPVPPPSHPWPPYLQLHPLLQVLVGALQQLLGAQHPVPHHVLGAAAAGRSGGAERGRQAPPTAASPPLDPSALPGIPVAPSSILVLLLQHPSGALQHPSIPAVTPSGPSQHVFFPRGGGGVAANLHFLGCSSRLLLNSREILASRPMPK